MNYLNAGNYTIKAVNQNKQSNCCQTQSKLQSTIGQLLTNISNKLELSNKIYQK